MRRPIFLKANHQLESRMHEICQSGSVGGAKSIFVPIPIIAQGLPWEIPTPELALKGLPGTARIGSAFLNRLVCSILSPFRAKRLFRLTQGKPWAKLSCPFGAHFGQYDRR